MLLPCPQSRNPTTRPGRRNLGALRVPKLSEDRVCPQTALPSVLMTKTCVGENRSERRLFVEVRSDLEHDPDKAHDLLITSEPMLASSCDGDFDHCPDKMERNATYFLWHGVHDVAKQRIDESFAIFLQP